MPHDPYAKMTKFDIRSIMYIYVHTLRNVFEINRFRYKHLEMGVEKPGPVIELFCQHII